MPRLRINVSEIKAYIILMPPFQGLSNFLSLTLIHSGFLYHISFFYDCLISLSIVKPHDKNETLIQHTKMNLSKLRNLSAHAPMNYLNKVHLVEAEMAAVYGDVPKAVKNYEEAISLSKKYGILCDEAICCERAGMFFLNSGSTTTASQMLLKACRCYNDWGAKAKVHQLTNRYPDIFAHMETFSRANVACVEVEEEASVSIMTSSANGGQLQTQKRRKN